MASFVNKLPPIVDSFQQSFVIRSGARVYFSPSPLSTQSTNDTTINPLRIHYTIKNQSNNINVFNTDYIDCGINILDYDENYYGYDAERKMYYIYIPNYLIAGDGFTNNTYYKIQIRFDRCDEGFEDKSLYLSSKTEYFSEWSTITLIKPISQPSFKFTQCGNNYGNFPIVGKLTFKNVDESEKLDHYYINIKWATTTQEEEIVYHEFTSDTIYTSGNEDPNEVNYIWYLPPSELDNSNTLTVKLYYTTNNGYEGNITTFPSVKDTFNNPLESLATILSNDRGTISLPISLTVQSNKNYIIYLRRASSLDNFNQWDLMFKDDIELLSGQSYQKNIVDHTPQSLTWYKYSIQFYDKDTTSFSKIVESNITCIDYDNDFMYDGEVQLPFRYGFKITAVKPYSNIIKIDTLGSKYPKFSQNTITDYKQYSISTTLTAEADYLQEFFNINEELGEDLYEQYVDNFNVQNLLRTDAEECWTSTNGIFYPHDDIMLERAFRKKVISWLSNGDPKLLKNRNEGNVIIMVTDPNMTPNQTLGGTIYDLTFTAYEIGNGNNIDDLIKCGICDSYSDLKEDPIPEPAEKAETLLPFICTVAVNQHLIDVESIKPYKYCNNLYIKATKTETSSSSYPMKIIIQQCNVSGKAVDEPVEIRLIETDGEYIYTTPEGILVKDIYIPTQSSVFKLDIQGIRYVGVNVETPTGLSNGTIDSVAELRQALIYTDHSLRDNNIGNMKWEDSKYIYEKVLNMVYGVEISGPVGTNIVITYIDNAGETINQSLSINDSGIVNLAYCDIVTKEEQYQVIEEYNYNIYDIAVAENETKIPRVTYLAEFITTKTLKEQEEE